jgi:hypothetical protein
MINFWSLEILKFNYCSKIYFLYFLVLGLRGVESLGEFRWKRESLVDIVSGQEKDQFWYQWVSFDERSFIYVFFILSIVWEHRTELENSFFISCWFWVFELFFWLFEVIDGFAKVYGSVFYMFWFKIG